MNELQSLANKFVRNVEEMVKEPANVILGDIISTLSLPKLSKEPATLLFDMQPENRRRTFPYPVAEESSDNRQLISEITSSIVPALMTALQQYVSNTSRVQSLSPSCETGSSENPT